ncbi:MAG: hypothetical protein QOI57_2086, partial [Rubrobacteraceae bacterium]|nr:hypothetical protein [Rubrobacteraceae bacterium]
PVPIVRVIYVYSSLCRLRSNKIGRHICVASPEATPILLCECYPVSPRPRGAHITRVLYLCKSATSTPCTRVREFAPRVAPDIRRIDGFALFQSTYSEGNALMEHRGTGEVCAVEETSLSCFSISSGIFLVGTNRLPASWCGATRSLCRKPRHFTRRVAGGGPLGRRYPSTSLRVSGLLLFLKQTIAEKTPSRQLPGIFSEFVVLSVRKDL